MNETVAKLSALSALLVSVWIGVYWLTPAEPRITVADLSAESTPPATPKKVLPTRDNPLPQKPPQPQPIEPPAQTTQPPPERELPPPAPQVIPPEFTEHIVQKNETFESIARKYFGPRASGAIIAKANPFMDPRRLRPGRVVRIPRDPNNIQGIPLPTPAAQENPPVPASGFRTYVVVAGDTLSKISAKTYGDARWADDIFAANRSQLADAHSLRIGQVLVIPERKPE